MPSLYRPRASTLTEVTDRRFRAAAGAARDGVPAVLMCGWEVEKKGFARDLCSYMRNYWGSVITDKYAFGGPFPRPDFIWQDHICCSHAKWYQVMSDLEGGLPQYCMDVAVGPYKDVAPHKIDYLVNQMNDGIEWLEATTGRTYNDDLLIEAAATAWSSTVDK